MQRQFEILKNPNFEEEKVLIENENIVLNGDYYHDKINEQIQGFLYALMYLKIDFNTKERTATEEEREKYFYG